MLFNSFDFLLFLPAVFVLYWFVFNKSVKLQNSLVVIVSYMFYGWWDYRFLALIVFSTLVDYTVGLKLQKTDSQQARKGWLYLSILVNLGLLAVFKYYNFFVENFVSAFSWFGRDIQASTLNIILPVGISFYTFQTLSYTIDVYKGKLKPTKDLIAFTAFVSFFPQLVAGPIERASKLLPQFKKQRKFDSTYAKSGFYLIIWGFFKKVVVADNCAFFVNQIFESPIDYSSGELLLGAILFSIQIYGDFSGYSDIAIGAARLYGFDLTTNFKFPYFSRNISEFWKRWHISLSSWFRDYVYIPLGGSNGTKLMQVRNVLVVFFLSAFWHGANWTFIVWGVLHAMCYVPFLFLEERKKYTYNKVVALGNSPKMVVTFFMVTILWIYFRADSVEVANTYLSHLFSMDDLSLNTFMKSNKTVLFSLIILFNVAVMGWFEWKSFKRNDQEVDLNFIKALVLLLSIAFMGVFKNPSNFIYFQF